MRSDSFHQESVSSRKYLHHQLVYSQHAVGTQGQRMGDMGWGGGLAGDEWRTEWFSREVFTGAQGGEPGSTFVCKCHPEEQETGFWKEMALPISEMFPHGPG